MSHQPTAFFLPDQVEKAITRLWNAAGCARAVNFLEVEAAYLDLRMEVKEALAAAANDPDAPIQFVTPLVPFVRHGIGECECYFRCSENPATGCSQSGRWHVHAGEPCPVHPNAPGDR